MQIERLKSLPGRQVREFYFAYLKLPCPDWQPERLPENVDETVERVMEIYQDSLDDRPSGLVIEHENGILEIVDIVTGEHIRMTFGEAEAGDAKEERFGALVHLAVVDIKGISKAFGDITGQLEEKEYHRALEIFRGLDTRFKFLEVILETVTKQIAN